MNIIDSTYFQFALAVPKETPAQQAFLANYIQRFEKQYLISALGATLYDEFMAGLAEPTVEQKWLDLLNGANFEIETYEGKTFTVKWNGLKNTEKESFLAYFVWYHLIADGVVKVGNGGGVYADVAENVSKQNPRTILTERFNNGLKLYGTIPSDWDVMGEINAYVRNTTDDINWMFQPNLFNFIYWTNKKTPDTYENWFFTGLNRLNILGI